MKSFLEDNELHRFLVNYTDSYRRVENDNDNVQILLQTTRNCQINKLRFYYGKSERIHATRNCNVMEDVI